MPSILLLRSLDYISGSLYMLSYLGLGDWNLHNHFLCFPLPLAGEYMVVEETYKFSQILCSWTYNMRLRYDRNIKT